MSSLGVSPDPRSGDVPPDRRIPSGVDRVITGLSCWWVAAPLLFLTPVIARAMGFPEVREEFGRIFGLAALGSAVVAPAVGFVVALIGRRRRARRRFAIMGAVSSVPVLFFWVFGVLLAECPDGYHC
ncbi:hypothetical protein NFX46_22010 [Streptomyces phaeoluteigriseus]|uniref:Major facilitator superfamily (MFS) profile domain-containing protein n=1 Tax=Streptomyces phaeoluteigriseus TaxID=114686 RepID=A0ABY4ZB05_9ACTN|nr:hypothetical protein [Streptomyces phaeoluteigriseus]USQ86140.1 hypothetical protein NFX46_22010 [Streptomyces phaeoluteigriseus]